MSEGAGRGRDMRTTRRPVSTAYHWLPQVRHSYGWTVTPLATWIALLGERVLSQFRQWGEGSRRTMLSFPIFLHSRSRLHDRLIENVAQMLFVQSSLSTVGDGSV